MKILLFLHTLTQLMRSLTINKPFPPFFLKKKRTQEDDDGRLSVGSMLVSKVLEGQKNIILPPVSYHCHVYSLHYKTLNQTWMTTLLTSVLPPLLLQLG